MHRTQFHQTLTTFVQVAFVLLTLCASSHAFAQEDAATMNRLNEEGFIEFRAGRYQEAAARFRAAYEAFPDPNLRKNEAVAWFKAGQCDQAIPAANSFLMAAEAGDADRLEARSILANCRVEMARAAIKSENLDLAETLLDEAESLEPDQYAKDQVAIARVELSERRSGHRGQAGARPSVAGWVLVASGAAVVGGTLAYWGLSASDRKVSEDPLHPDHERASKRARTSRWLVPVGLVGGGVFTGIGIYLVLAGSGQDGSGGASAGMTYRW